jgi:Carboxypeptidase regulatory-like domain
LQTRIIQISLAVALVSTCSRALESAGFEGNTTHPTTTTLVSPALWQNTSITDARFKISGTVLDALTNAPLAQTRVTLIDSKNRGQAIWTVTSKDGRFEFTSLPAHKFALQGARRGYLRTAYDQHGQFSTAIVTGVGLGTENLVLRLTPLSGISGRVLDESGDPVRNAAVMLYREDQDGLRQIRSRDRDMTDDQGFYEFSNLAPGSYFLSANAKPWYAVNPPHADGNVPVLVDRAFDVVYPAAFYNGVTDSDGATPIPLKGGDHLQIDLHLSPIPALHVIFRIPESYKSQHGFPMLQRREFDSTEYMELNNVRQSEAGVYELTGLPPGRYSLERPGPKTPEKVGELDLRTDNQEVELSRAESGSSVTFSVKLPGDAPLPGELFLALQNSRHDPLGYSQVDTSGHATFSSVTPGKYSIVVYSGSVPSAVARVSTREHEMDGREITVTPGSSQDLTVLLTQGVVSIEGFVKRGNKPTSGAMIVLAPQDPESHQELFRRDQSDLDGSFVVRGVIPGSYTILALENAWTMPWREPGALTPYLAKGQSLTIGALMQRSVVLPETLEPQPR